ncbi:hypothetical protein BRARA_I01484, partial [Brassica rapa]
SPILTNRSCSWNPPSKNWLKCNSSGTWNKNKENSGLGWICRDEKCHVLWTGARTVTRLVSTIITETEVLEWSAETLAGFGYKNIIFESDSLTLVKMINGVEEVWPMLQPTIEVIRQSLSQIQSL